MATKTWTDVDNANLEPGDPIRSVDIIALNDNDTASFEGATGAPKLSLSAIETITSGTTIRSRDDSESTVTVPALNPSPITVSGGAKHVFSFMQRGSVRVTAQHKTSSGSATSTLYIYRTRNGSNSVNQWSTTSTSYVTRTVDINVLPGDVITISHEITGTSSQTGYVQNARFQTSGENLWPGSGARLENTYEAL